MNAIANKKIGIMGAMLQEVADIVAILDHKKEYHLGKRIFYTGLIRETEVVVVFSRWGKVAAATTVSTLIHSFNITELIFTGVAGAINNQLKIGDIVIGEKFFQHDMDARPIMKEFEIPLLGVQFFEVPKEKIHAIQNKITPIFQNKRHYQHFSDSDITTFGIQAPSIHIGDIASGDHFFSDAASKKNLQIKLPTILCVEMEGAAVAQVCDEHEIPYCIIRTISDEADEQSSVDFMSFANRIASKYSLLMIRQLI